jgi:ParB-like chromosome segregation protein Spo0J
MKLAISYKPTVSLIPYASNARTHNDAQVAQIAGSIGRFGFVNPVLIGDDGVIIAGHGRVLAARKLGLAEVPVIALKGLTEAQRRALALADNRIALNSGWDAELLRSEMQMLSDSGEDIDGLGFDKKEIDGLFAAEENVIVEEVPVTEVNDRFWISIRGPLRDQADVLQRMQRAMDGLSDVDVELGTVSVDF